MAGTSSDSVVREGLFEGVTFVLGHFGIDHIKKRKTGIWRLKYEGHVGRPFKGHTGDRYAWSM